MATSKLVLREKDVIMNDFRPTYDPLLPIFMQGGQKHEMEVGVDTFKRLEAVSDLRAKHITPKDTVMHNLVAIEKTKTFKKYPFGSQFVRSTLQDNEQNESFVKQVLDESFKHADEIFMLGDGGTSTSDVVNNGLFWSGDSNYVTESSTELDSDQDLAISLYQAVQANAVVADQIEGQKLIIFYGSNIVPIYRSLFAASSRSFKSALSESLPDYRHMELHSSITPASSHGWLIVNLNQVKLHYTEMPQLWDQGINSEKMHVWQNFLYGSMMLDVLVSGAIIKQAATIEA